jgi:hypothetical protein
MHDSRRSDEMTLESAAVLYCVTQPEVPEACCPSTREVMESGFLNRSFAGPCVISCVDGAPVPTCKPRDAPRPLSARARSIAEGVSSRGRALWRRSFASRGP